MSERLGVSTHSTVLHMYSALHVYWSACFASTNVFTNECKKLTA